MKKLLFFTLLCLLVSFINVFAAVAIYENGIYKGEATAIDIAAGQSVGTFTNGEKANLPFSTNLFGVGMYNGNVTTVTVSDTTFGTMHYRAAIVALGTRTLTLSNGTPGQLLTLIVENSYSALGTVTLTATTKYGWSSATLDSENDTITLLYLDDTYGWIVIGDNGVTTTHTLY